MNGIDSAAALIKQARHVIALTGAGISTPSGIPDFRSPHSGLWNKVDPMKVASLQGFLANPRAYYEWRKPLRQTLRTAQPNPAHHALATLEARGHVCAVVTQNIDGLHQRAGSQRVYEVHGNARELVCLACRQVVVEEAQAAHVTQPDGVLYCGLCGGLLKPNVVFFGELLPYEVVREVEREVRLCDLIIVVGSSLEVFPACDWPREAIQHGARAMVINYQPTYLDERADVVIHDDVATTLPELVAALEL
jgi:NAD-dependent deacetylase